MKLYRDMRMTEDGLPELGASSSTLGVRIRGCTVPLDFRRPDVLVNANGLIETGVGGMSVTPPKLVDNVSDMSVDRIDRGTTVMWMIDTSVLAKYELVYRPDPRAAFHGFIEPIEFVAPLTYNENIQKTQGEWEVCYELQSK